MRREGKMSVITMTMRRMKNDDSDRMKRMRIGKNDGEKRE